MSEGPAGGRAGALAPPAPSAGARIRSAAGAVIASPLGSQALVILGVILAWEALARAQLFSPLLLPSFSATIETLARDFGGVLARTGVTLLYIGYGMLAGLILALAMTFAALRWQTCADLVELSLTILHPVPAVALLPLLILWLGLTPWALVIIIVNSCLWPLLQNCYTGFRSISQTYIEVGRNIGLRGPRLFLAVTVRAALPYFLSGIAIAWARAWRAAITVEMVFGASTASGGIGWYIYTSRFMLDMPAVLAGTLVIVAIGVIAERGVLDAIQARTVIRWGMVR